MSTKVWAAHVSTAKHGVSGTDLHATYREALEAVADYVCIGHEGDPSFSDEAIEKLSDDELYDWIQEHADDDGTEWDITEAQPPKPGQVLPIDRQAEIKAAIADLKDAAERLRLAGCPYARLAVMRARKSVEGALRHAERGFTGSTRRVKRPRRLAS